MKKTVPKPAMPTICEMPPGFSRNRRNLLFCVLWLATLAIVLLTTPAQAQNRGADKPQRPETNQGGVIVDNGGEDIAGGIRNIAYDIYRQLKKTGGVVNGFRIFTPQQLRRFYNTIGSTPVDAVPGPLVEDSPEHKVVDAKAVLRKVGKVDEAFIEADEAKWPKLFEGKPHITVFHEYLNVMARKDKGLNDLKNRLSGKLDLSVFTAGKGVRDQMLEAFVRDIFPLSKHIRVPGKIVAEYHIQDPQVDGIDRWGAFRVMDPSEIDDEVKPYINIVNLAMRGRFAELRTLMRQGKFDVKTVISHMGHWHYNHNILSLIVWFYEQSMVTGRVVAQTGDHAFRYPNTGEEFIYYYRTQAVLDEMVGFFEELLKMGADPTEQIFEEPDYLSESIIPRLFRLAILDPRDYPMQMLEAVLALPKGKAVLLDEKIHFGDNLLSYWLKAHHGDAAFIGRSDDSIGPSMAVPREYLSEARWREIYTLLRQAGAGFDDSFDGGFGMMTSARGRLLNRRNKDEGWRATYAFLLNEDFARFGGRKVMEPKQYLRCLQALDSADEIDDGHLAGWHVIPLAAEDAEADAGTLADGIYREADDNRTRRFWFASNGVHMSKIHAVADGVSTITPDEMRPIDETFLRLANKVVYRAAVTQPVALLNDVLDQARPGARVASKKGRR